MKLGKRLISNPYIIAGPCSAESPEQLDTIANAFVDTGINVFRAGAWKPRTRPNSFEGHGEHALQWLVDIRQKYGFPVAIEVANTNHVELALKYDIDVLWLGTRTTTSPFTVEAIAESLSGTEKSVVIKNPICPDMGLWVGAVERFQHHNVNNLMVIHRGFKVYESHKYRSEPYWQIAAEFKTIFPNIPMILDPSHIAGQRELIDEVIQESQNYHYDGMMIEVHPSPDTALSDKNQQIIPDHFKTLMSQLKPGKISQAVS